MYYRLLIILSNLSDVIDIWLAKKCFRILEYFCINNWVLQVYMVMDDNYTMLKRAIRKYPYSGIQFLHRIFESDNKIFEQGTYAIL